MKSEKQLRKNTVFIDIIVMGELEENEPKLRDSVNAVNGATAAAATGEDGADAVERTCHLTTISVGILPSNVLVTSPILQGVEVEEKEERGERLQKVPEHVEEEAMALLTLEECIPIWILSWPWLYLWVSMRIV